MSLPPKRNPDVCALYLPKPFGNVCVRGAVLQSRVALPILHIHRSQSGHYQLQLLLIELFEEVWRYELLETFLDGHELLLDSNSEPPLDVEVDVFLLVVIGDRDILTVGFEIVLS